MARYYAEKDPEFPCFYYPWNDMTAKGDHFIVETAEAGKNIDDLYETMKSAVRNATKRQKHMHKSFDVSITEDKEGVRVTLIDV